MSDEHTPDDDVLEPFVTEWAERARRAKEAIDAILAANASTRVPRLEVGRRVGGAHAYVLVRNDPPDKRSTTVWFSDEEWALVSRAVLLSHGLKATNEQETA